MQNRRLARLGGACALIVALGLACEPAPPQAPLPDDATDDDAAAGLVFETSSVERTLDDCIAGAPGCTYVRFDHPNVVESSPELAESAQAITDAVQDFLSQPLTPDEEPATPRAIFDRFLADARAAAETIPWFLERRAFVLHHTPRIVSLGFVERQFLGGAHPLETYRFQNFDLETGATLRLSDVVPGGRQEQLRLVAERRFREARGIEPDTDLTEAGFRFDEARFTLTENFAIEDDGLSFYYNPYDIAAYSEGPTEVKLSYDELDGLLSPLVAGDR